MLIHLWYTRFVWFASCLSTVDRRPMDGPELKQIRKDLRINAHALVVS